MELSLYSIFEKRLRLKKVKNIVTIRMFQAIFCLSSWIFFRETLIFILLNCGKTESFDSLSLPVFDLFSFVREFSLRCGY